MAPQAAFSQIAGPVAATLAALNPTSSDGAGPSNAGAHSSGMHTPQDFVRKDSLPMIRRPILKANSIAIRGYTSFFVEVEFCRRVAGFMTRPVMAFKQIM